LQSSSVVGFFVVLWTGLSNTMREGTPKYFAALHSTLWVSYVTGEGVHYTCNGGNVFTSVIEGFHGCAKVFEVVRRPPKTFRDVHRSS
jgi:uncharacterized membrane protein (DUF441 family)